MFSTNYFQYLSNKYGEFGIFVDQTDENQLKKDLYDEQSYNSYVNNEISISKAVDPFEMSESFYNLLKSLW